MWVSVTVVVSAIAVLTSVTGDVVTVVPTVGAVSVVAVGIAAVVRAGVERVCVVRVGLVIVPSEEPLPPPQPASATAARTPRSAITRRAAALAAFMPTTVRGPAR